MVTDVMENKFIFNSDRVQLKEVEEKGEKKYIIEGYISTGDKDLVNDIVTEKCMFSMAQQLKERTIKLDLEHESYRGNNSFEVEANKTIIPVGKITDFNLDKKGLKVQAEINPVHSRFQEVWGSLKGEYLDAFSIAYIPTETSIARKDGGEVRMLDNLNLLNVALTGNPVNPEASMSKVMAKSLEFMKAKMEMPPKGNADGVFGLDTMGKGAALPASPKPKETESEPTEEEEEEDEETKNEKLGYPESKKSQESCLDTLKGGFKMTEKEKLSKKEEAEKEEEEKKKAPKKEKKDESPAEPEKAVEPKPVESEGPKVDAEVKSLRAELDKHKAELTEIKALLEKPQVKALSGDMKAELATVGVKSTVGPLDVFN